jgi:hypothetical protein
MKRAQWTALFCALALVLLWELPVGAFEIGARAYYWFPAFKTDMKSDGAGLPGTDLNLKDNLGVATESFPSLEAFGAWGDHHLSLTYTPVNYSGSTTLVNPINFNGQTFAAGGINTDLKLRMLDLEYRYTFLDVHAGYKIIRLRIDQKDLLLNSEFTGPYVALTVSY